jgi:hypothetical protein
MKTKRVKGSENPLMKYHTFLNLTLFSHSLAHWNGGKLEKINMAVSVQLFDDFRCL